jgi:crotonobetainyl-CoA:carnitine CoA-transferase CaiB-like acyl-CoA transferase
MAQALSHLRVMELCDDIPGAACARQFAAWGADVTVAEPPGGSPLRRLPPLVSDREGRSASLVWEYLGANKRSVTVDLEDAASRRAVRTLVERADVLVTDRRPAWLAAAGLDDDALATVAPGLVLVAVSAFGRDGPYAGYAASDLVVQALSGMLSLSGAPNRMPLKVAANVLPHACGVSAFVGALAALHEREASGRGQVVEVATVEAVASLVLFLRAQYFGEPFPRRSGVGTALLRCRDGHILCNPRAFRAWDDLLVALDVPPEAVPEPLRTPEGREDTGALLAFLEAQTRERPAKELFLALGTLMVAGYLETPAQLLNDEHLRARGFFRTIEHPRLGRLIYPGPAGQMSETPMVAPAPMAGAVVTNLRGVDNPPPGPLPEGRGSLTQPPLPEARSQMQAGGEAGSDGRLRLPLPPGRERRVRSEPGRAPGAPFAARSPLADVRVLDLTTAWIGPYAGMLLADLGADVIKIEGPGRPDTWRFFHAPSGPALPLPPVARPGAHPGNARFYYNAVNRNKRGLALDLASERGKALFLELVRTADVVLENFTPRVLENFGLGYEVLRDVNPGIILVSFSGYGRTGPYRDIKATGATIETIGGWVSLFGYPDEPPMLMGEMEADPTSGLHAAALALVALGDRDRTGRGQRIDGSMFEAAVGYIGEEILLASLGQTLPHPRGNRDRAMAPQGAFPCKGKDQWLAITVRHDDDWRALLGVAAAAPWLRDGRFETAVGRLAHVEEVEAAVARWTLRHGARALMSALQRAGVPAGVVLKTDEAPQGPHFRAREWFQPLTHPDTGTQMHNGYPWRFSRSPLVWRRPAPCLGEHSEQILASQLDLDAAEIASLFERGVIRTVLDRTPEDAAAPT